MFKGLGTALITPFEEDGRIDYTSLEKLICAQLDAGVNALVICGTTGEPPAMTDTERSDVIRFAVRTVAGRIPVIAGTGSNCTASAAANSRRAEELGADGVLVVTPYYNKCTQDGLFLHYRTVAESTSLPVIAYNVPGRTGVNLLPSTAARLTEIPNLAGIKEASGNITQVINIAKAIEGSNISLFSGDDPADLRGGRSRSYLGRVQCRARQDQRTHRRLPRGRLCHGEKTAIPLSALLRTDVRRSQPHTDQGGVRPARTVQAVYASAPHTGDRRNDGGS